jgi:hypothetical protein
MHRLIREQLHHLPLRRHAAENKTMNAKRFPNCSCSKYCVHDQGTFSNVKLLWPNASQSYRSFPVAMAGKIRGAINACLDFLLHFCVKTKVERRKFHQLFFLRDYFLFAVVIAEFLEGK